MTPSKHNNKSGCKERVFIGDKKGKTKGPHKEGEKKRNTVQTFNQEHSRGGNQGRVDGNEMGNKINSEGIIQEVE